MQFEEPNIHNVRRVTAGARGPLNPGLENEVNCLTLHLHGRGAPAEFKMFFAKGGAAYAHALAAAINAVPADVTMADAAAIRGLAAAQADMAEEVA